MVSCMLQRGLVATDALCRHQLETSSKLLTFTVCQHIKYPRASINYPRVCINLQIRILLFL